MAEPDVSSSSQSSGSQSPDGVENIKVVVRCRPFTEREKCESQKRVVEMDIKQGTLVLNPAVEEPIPKKSFTFDAVYDSNSTQCDLYDGTFREVVDEVLQGYNGTIFAYGQTGAGKSFTLQGVHDVSFPELDGVILRSFEHIFQHISHSKNKQYLVYSSYLQIYQEEIYDLLEKDRCKRLYVKEDPRRGFYVKDLSSYVTKNVAEMKCVLYQGNQNKVVWATNCAIDIRRTCNIFTVTVEHCQIHEDVEKHVRVGHLQFVDMPGSEKPAKTGVIAERLKEGASIGYSLSPFGEVISALTAVGKSRLVPYRGSQLTKLLKDSLGGTAKTVMVANIGPASCNYNETLSTLRYADRIKRIKNKPKINVDPKYSLMPEVWEEIERLRTWLADWTQQRNTTSKIRGNMVCGSDKVEINADDDAIEEYLQEYQAKLESEKKAMLQKQNMPQWERDRLSELPETLKLLLKKEKESIEELSSRIKKLESKLLVGGSDVADDTDTQHTANSFRTVKN